MVWSSYDGGTAENLRASERVATRRQSFDRPNRISIRSRRLSLYPFVFQRLPEPIGIIGPVGQKPVSRLPKSAAARV